MRFGTERKHRELRAFDRVVKMRMGKIPDGCMCSFRLGGSLKLIGQKG